jgi:hypothetical protein
MVAIRVINPILFIDFLLSLKVGRTKTDWAHELALSPPSTGASLRKKIDD